MRYMLDTNICIHLMQKQPAQVGEHLSRLSVGDVVISAVTYAELRAGVERRTGEREVMDRLLHRFIGEIPVLPFDENAAEQYGRLRAAVPDRRRDALDRMIASHAVSRDLVLVTNNEADFRDYPGLRLENWVNAPH